MGIEVGHSMVSEWDLVCNDDGKLLADSMFFVGFFFGAGLLGQLADIKGRWVAMYMSLAIAAMGRRPRLHLLVIGSTSSSNYRSGSVAAV